MDDRFTRGLLAGFIGWLPAMIYNFIAFYLNFSTLRFLDFASVFIYGNRPKNTLETLFGFLAVMVFMSILGAIFAFLVKGIGSANIYLKGWLYGNTLWFAFYTITVLFKVSLLMNVNLATAFSNFIGASIWGITLAYALTRLDEKVKQGE